MVNLVFAGLTERHGYNPACQHRFGAASEALAGSVPRIESGQALRLATQGRQVRERYGTVIPACILVMAVNLDRPAAVFR
jgi:hypothetical protein